MQNTNPLITILKKSKITKKIIDSFEKIDRKNYFDPVFYNEIYSESCIPIGYGQKSDDPVTLTKMIDILSPTKKMHILEVGTGSGFSTALLSTLVHHVVTIEYNEDLAKKAKDRILKENITNVTFFTGDASEISDEMGAFDAIIIWAACRQTPLAIFESIAPGGKAVYPMGPVHEQQIVEYIPDSNSHNHTYKYHDFCIFESIRGPYGWDDIIEGYIVDDAKV